MNTSDTLARDLDLNLLRVFVVVAEERSATAAGKRLYLTQPAISAALKRLATAIGAPLFARQGRGLALTTRGERLFAAARPHLEALVAAAAAAPAFDPVASERTVRIGLSDVTETWLLPTLLRLLAREAPRMRFVVVPVQFRTVARELASGAIDFAVTIADELPAGIRREPLFFGGFSCLFDPRHAQVGPTLTRKAYFAHQHVIVSYNADLRGLIEDLGRARRDVRVSVPSFHGVGALVEGSPLLATVPTLVGRLALRHHPRLRLERLPLPIGGAPLELFWRSALDDDESVRFVMDHVARIAKRVARDHGEGARGLRRSRAGPPRPS